MATKYKRQGFRDAAKGSHHAERDDPARRTRSLKRRLLVIYAGVGAAAVILLFADRMVGLLQLARETMLESTATVAEKFEEQDASGITDYTVVLEVTLDDGAVRTDEVFVDAESWRTFEVGMTVDVLYRLSPDRSYVRVEEIFPRAQDEADATADGSL